MSDLFGHKANLNNLNDIAEQAEQDINNIEEDITDLQNDITTLNTNITGTESLINRIDNMETEISSLSTTSSLPNLSTLQKLGEDNGILMFNGSEIITSNISTNVVMYQPTGSPIEMAQNDEVTVTHPTCTNEKMMFTVYEEEAGISGLTNIETDFDLEDRSKFIEQDSVNGTDFVDGKVQLKQIGYSSTDYETSTSVPTMTSDSLPSGVASASSELSSTYAAYKAFDGDSSSLFSTNSNIVINVSNPASLSYEFPLGGEKYIGKYSIQNKNAVSATMATPCSWILQGTDDDATYINLHTVDSNYSLLAGAIREFTFTATKAYKAYRLLVTRTTQALASSITNLVNIGVAMDVLLFLSNGTLLIGANNGRIYRSSDNGSTISGSTLVSSATTPRIMQIIQSSNGDVFAIDNTGYLYKSTDNGVTWGTGILPFGNTGTCAMLLELTNGNILVGKYSTGQIYKSTDHGANFSLLSTAPAISIAGGVQASDGTIIIASNASAPVIYKSIDNGITWGTAYSIPNASGGVYQIRKRVNGSIICASYSGGIHISYDSGATFPVLISGDAACVGIAEIPNTLDIISSNRETFYLEKRLESTVLNITQFNLYQNKAIYPTIGKYITTSDNSHFNLSLVGTINSISIAKTVPVNTSIKMFISFDNRNTWLYYDSTTSSLKSATNGISDISSYGNSPSVISDILSNYSVNDEEYLDLAFMLKTDDELLTPLLDQVTYNYNEKSHYELCTIGRYSSSMDYGVKRVDPNTTRFKKLTSGTAKCFISVLV